MSLEWTIIVLGFVVANTYFSYRYGFEQGEESGIAALLATLISSEVIVMDEDTGIIKAKKENTPNDNAK
jgi:hypothetical protein